MAELKIKLLPDFIANQIAAGEVVQRPESVVKELVENSLDAGADSIAVIIKNSGKQLIHVVDNGEGMNREDLTMSVKRHATSKIINQEDLERITTFGFRGEALASIGSVANLEIRTKRAEEEIGWKLLAEPNQEVETEPCNTGNGTQIFVRNLFYNVPARRKFLKSNLTEFRHISDTMIKFALSNTDVRFTFYDSDSLIFDVKPAKLRERIGDVLGGKVSGSLIEVHHENQYITISGYIGQPQIARQSRAGQYLFLNGRSITSKSLSHAVFAAFEHLLEKNSHPLFVLNLKINPENIDVNVHPQKHEVKFDDERFVYKLVNQAVFEALQQVNMTPEMRFRDEDVSSPIGKSVLSPEFGSSDIMLVNKVTGEILEPTLPAENKSYSGSFSFSDRNIERMPGPGRDFKTEISAFDDLFGKNEQPQTGAEFAEKTQAAPGNQFETPYSMYWQLHKKYILVQSMKGMILIDQHNAHERVLYEKAIKAMNKEFAYAQNLLFPVTLELNTSELALVKEIQDDLLNLGYNFSIEEDADSGKALLELNGVPLDIKNGAEEDSFREIIEEYQENKKIKHTDKRDNLAASFSCKSAIKTGYKLNVEEMKKLHEDLMKCSMPYVCPHGRPVIIEFSLHELDTRFGRTPTD